MSGSIQSQQDLDRLLERLLSGNKDDASAASAVYIENVRICCEYFSIKICQLFEEGVDNKDILRLIVNMGRFMKQAICFNKSQDFLGILKDRYLKFYAKINGMQSHIANYILNNLDIIFGDCMHVIGCDEFVPYAKQYLDSPNPQYGIHVLAIYCDAMAVCCETGDKSLSDSLLPILDVEYTSQDAMIEQIRLFFALVALDESVKSKIEIVNRCLRGLQYNQLKEALDLIKLNIKSNNVVLVKPCFEVIKSLIEMLGSKDVFEIDKTSILDFVYNLYYSYSLVKDFLNDNFELFIAPLFEALSNFSDNEDNEESYYYMIVDFLEELMEKPQFYGKVDEYCKQFKNTQNPILQSYIIRLLHPPNTLQLAFSYIQSNVPILVENGLGYVKAFIEYHSDLLLEHHDLMTNILDYLFEMQTNSSVDEALLKLIELIPEEMVVEYGEKIIEHVMTSKCPQSVAAAAILARVAPDQMREVSGQLLNICTQWALEEKDGDIKYKYLDSLASFLQCLDVEVQLEFIQKYFHFTVNFPSLPIWKGTRQIVSVIKDNMGPLVPLLVASISQISGQEFEVMTLNAGEETDEDTLKIAGTNTKMQFHSEQLDEIRESIDALSDYLKMGGERFGDFIELAVRVISISLLVKIDIGIRLSAFNLMMSVAKVYPMTLPQFEPNIEDFFNNEVINEVTADALDMISSTIVEEKFEKEMITFLMDFCIRECDRRLQQIAFLRQNGEYDKEEELDMRKALRSLAKLAKALLGRLGNDMNETIFALREKFMDPQFQDVKAVRIALATLAVDYLIYGPGSSECQSLISQALEWINDTNKYVREVALLGIGYFAPRHIQNEITSVCQMLIQTIADPNFRTPKYIKGTDKAVASLALLISHLADEQTEVDDLVQQLLQMLPITHDQNSIIVTYFELFNTIGKHSLNDAILNQSLTALSQNIQDRKIKRRLLAEFEEDKDNIPQAALVLLRKV